MEEPSLSINGDRISQEDILADLNDKLEDLDEFDIAIDDDFSFKPEEKEESPERHFYEEYKGYKVKVTPQGHDWRGLPMINYMGEVRPHYSALDKETQQVLQIQMIAELSNDRQLYPDLGIPDDKTLMSYSLNVLHTYRNEKKKIIQGMKYGVFYEKAIIGTCMTIEGILTTLGVNFVKDFTANQVKIIPIYKIFASNIATQQGAGPLEGQSPTNMVAIAIVMSLGLYCGARYLKGEENGTNIYKILSEMANNNFSGPSPTTTTNSSSTRKNIETEKKTTEARVPSPLETPEETAPSLSFAGIDIGNAMSQVGTFLPMISSLMGSGDDKEKKKKKKKKKKYRQ